MVEDEIKKDVEKLKSEIQKKKEEIEQIRKNIDELNKKMLEKEKTENDIDLKNIAGQISDLFNVTFNILGMAGGTNQKKASEGLLGLIDNLAELSEKSESFKKEFELAGKRGSVEYIISARPLRGRIVGHESLHQRTMKRGMKPLAGTHLQELKPGEEREPITDITENDDEIIVFMELPGIHEKDIMIDVDQNILKITINKEKKEVKEIPLPKSVQKIGLISKYNNGILEVRIKKTKQDKSDEA